MRKYIVILIMVLMFAALFSSPAFAAITAVGTAIDAPQGLSERHGVNVKGIKQDNDKERKSNYVTDGTPLRSMWEVSVGQTYRFIERDFTGGLNFAVTKKWQNSNWRVSFGVITAQTLHTTKVHHNAAEGRNGRIVHRIIDQKIHVASYAYLTGQYIHVFREGRLLRPFLAFGPSVHDKAPPVEGGYLSWASSIGVHIGKHYGFEFRHNSNAGLWQPNWGQDVLSLLYRF